MEVLGWIVIGGLAGFLASKVTGTEVSFVPGIPDWLETIVVGIIGAFLGGLVLGLFGTGSNELDFDLWSLLTAFVGATLLLWAYKLAARR